MYLIETPRLSTTVASVCDLVSGVTGMVTAARAPPFLARVTQLAVWRLRWPRSRDLITGLNPRSRDLIRVGRFSWCDSQDRLLQEVTRATGILLQFYTLFHALLTAFIWFAMRTPLHRYSLYISQDRYERYTVTHCMLSIDMRNLVAVLHVRLHLRYHYTVSPLHRFTRHSRPGERPFAGETCTITNRSYKCGWDTRNNMNEGLGPG